MTFQTPGGPAAKRRRIDDAAATLRKPFRSPLISRQQGTPGTGNDGHGIATASTTTPQIPATPLPARPLRPAAASPSVTSSKAGQRQRQHAATASPLGRVSSRSPISTKQSTTADTLITKNNTKNGTKDGTSGPSPHATNDNDSDNLLQRILASQREMQLHVRAARQRLDLARQAAQIEQAARKREPSSVGKGEEAGRKGEEGEEDAGTVTEPDAELRALVVRWKNASRLAADELFGLIKERVDGMGGAKAWRESRKRQRDFYGGFEDGTVGNKGGGDGDEKNDDEGEGEGEGGEANSGEDEEEEQEDETEFTMLMMLKSLNIDPDVLGYDPVEDKWRE